MFKKLGSWLFLLGILVAVIVGVAIGYNGGVEEMENLTWTTPAGALLAVLGFIVGILSFFAIGSITKERVPTFLIGALILVVIGASAATWEFGDYYGLVPYFQSITTCIALFAAPAAGLLAIRAIWDAGKTEEIEKVIPHVPLK